MTDNLNTLTDCPFCNGETSIQEDHWRDGNLCGGAPFCRKCGAKMPRYWPKREAEAIAAWNARAQPTGDVGALEATIETVTVLTFEELEAVKQAAHIAALEEAAEVAEDIEMDWGAWGPAETREAIAAAIRALKGPTDGL